MSIRFILQYSKTPSHALTVSEPWTRLLVETESPSGRGHVIGKDVELRKTTAEFNIITAIEVNQLQSDPTKALRYLNAAKWWLHRAPFGVERLPVKLIVYARKDEQLYDAQWRIKCLQLCYSSGLSTTTVEKLRSHLPDVEELSLCGDTPVQVVDSELLSECKQLRRLSLTYSVIAAVTSIPLKHLTALNLHGCHLVRDIEHLSKAYALRELDLGSTFVENCTALSNCTGLRKIDLSVCSITDFSFLAALRELRELSVSNCTGIRDLQVFTHLKHLERLDIAHTPVSSLRPLAACRALRELDVSYCAKLEDLSDLSDAISLEKIVARSSGVRVLTDLARCPSLREVDFSDCAKLEDLSGFDGAASLEKIVIRGSGVCILTGLARCPSLREVDFSDCSSLRDLSGLSGASSLQVVDCLGTSVRSFLPLHTCPMLRYVRLPNGSRRSGAAALSALPTGA